jgi:hypothetical protein
VKEKDPFFLVFENFRDDRDRFKRIQTTGGGAKNNKDEKRETREKKKDYSLHY